MKYIFFVGYILLLSNNMFSQWSEVHLIADYPRFKDIKFLDKQRGLIVGDNGTILRSTDSGVSWKLVPSVTTKSLKDIQFSSEFVYACGDSGTILRSNNKGESWSRIPFPYQINLESIYFIDSLIGFVVGDGSIAKSTNGGISWERINYTDTYFQSNMFINRDTGFVTGFIRLGGGSFNSIILKTTNQGNSWFTQLSECGLELYEIIFIDSIGYVAGENERFFRSTDFGQTWYQPKPTPCNSPENYLSVHFFDALNGWVTGDHNYIYRTTNGGIDWKIQLSKFDVNKSMPLSSITFLDNSNGFAVGTQMVRDSISGWNYLGILFKTTNGGTTFVEADINFSSPTRFELFQNFPNPFNSETNIKFTLPDLSSSRMPAEILSTSIVTLKVYDILGREVATLINEEKEPGTYEVRFSTIDYPLNSGVYFYKLVSREFTDTKKMIVLE
jgi:photosystem II stability/assembly factor-like uncharacterized protein